MHTRQLSATFQALERIACNTAQLHELAVQDHRIISPWFIGGFSTVSVQAGARRDRSRRVAAQGSAWIVGSISLQKDFQPPDPPFAVALRARKRPTANPVGI